MVRAGGDVSCSPFWGGATLAWNSPRQGEGPKLEEGIPHRGKKQLWPELMNLYLGAVVQRGKEQIVWVKMWALPLSS